MTKLQKVKHLGWSRPALLGGVSLLAAGWGSQWARADEFHYNNILVGERAAGMGGAFTAVADDPSGSYYNPAGMVYAFENYISISANTYAMTSTTYKNILPGYDYNRNSSGLVPSFFGFSQNFGKTKVAFALAVPNSDLTDQDDTFTSIPASSSSAKEMRRRLFIQDTTYYFGPSISKSLTDRFSIGISVFAAYRTYRVIDNQFFNFRSGDKYFIQNNASNGSAWGLQPRVGLQVMPTDRMAVGLVLSKTLNLIGNYKTRDLSTQTSGGVPVAPDGTYTHDMTTTDSSGQLRLQAPLTTTLGVALFPKKTLLFSGDFTYYTADPSYKGVNLVSTWNTALGAEWFPSQGVALRFGAFTNRANTPALVSGKMNQPLHVDQYGGSLGLSLLKPGSSFTLGAIYTYGTGQGQGLGDNTAIQKVTQSGLAGFLSGSYQL